MYCKFCGKQIDDDSCFCSHCGKSVGAGNSSEEIGVEEKEAPVQGDIYDPSVDYRPIAAASPSATQVQGAPGVEVETEDDDEDNESSVRWGIVLIPIFIILIVIAIAAAAGTSSMSDATRALKDDDYTYTTFEDLTSVTVQIVPQRDIESCTVRVKLYNGKGEEIFSDSISKTDLKKGSSYNYTFEFGFKNALYGNKIKYGISGECKVFAP